MKIATETVGAVAVLDLGLRVLDRDSADEFRAAMAEPMAEAKDVVLDIGKLAFIDSSGLGAILSCLRQLRLKGGDLRLCRLTAAVRSMLELVRMHRVIDIHDTREDAVASFG